MQYSHPVMGEPPGTGPRRGKGKSSELAIPLSGTSSWLTAARRYFPVKKVGPLCVTVLLCLQIGVFIILFEDIQFYYRQ